MNLYPSNIADVSNARKELWYRGHLEYWVDPEQLNNTEIKQLIALKKRNADCVYLWLALDCDDKTLEKAKANEIAWIETQYAIFNAQRSSAMIIEQERNASAWIVG